MITVETRYYAYLREVTGVREEKITLEDGATVATLIEALTKKYGPKFRDYVLKANMELRQNIAIAVNDVKVSEAPLKKVLRDGDRVVIIPPISGGGLSPKFSQCVEVHSSIRSVDVHDQKSTYRDD